ncbi:MAG: homoserine dehydrogenase [Firmicutes bacterium]|nr:homoserine dehydrogenase [Candidatus Caballimonas caccae]
MKKVGVAILGLGVVGGGTYNIIKNNHDYFVQTQNMDINVEMVLEKNLERAKSLGIPEANCAQSIEEVVSNPNVDIVVEVIGGVEPSKTFVLKALMSGKSVVTSNKELFAKHWSELEEEAKRTGAGLFFEASCVGGVPIIRALQEGMQANKIESIKGIINGTTNYILTKMANEGTSYEDALKEAQRLGYAEFNPTADVEGFDATYKLSILSSLAFNTKVCIDNVHREGITNIKKEDVEYGKQLGYTMKLLGIGKNTKDGIEVRVHPTLVSNSNPLASVNDSFNAVHLVGDSVGEIMLYGRGAGALPTGSAIVSDIIYAAKHADFYYASFENNEKGNAQTKFATDFNSKFFIRLSVEDKAGVLSKITSAFAKNNVSLKELKQVKETLGSVPLVIITHDCYESAVKKSLEKISEMEEVISVDSLIKVED